MFDNVNKASKRGPIGKIPLSVKIGQFYELVYNLIIYLSVFISIESMNPCYITCNVGQS